MKKLAVVGAGGCAREVAWTVRDWIGAGAPFEFAGYVITDRAALGKYDALSAPIYDLEELARLRNVDAFVLGVGSPALRRQLLKTVSEHFPGAVWPAVIHPSVCADHQTLSIAEGVVICANTTVTVNVRIDAHALIHYGCTVSHEAVIGANAVLNPGCNISGGVRIGNDALIGVGAQVLQYRVIGEGAVVGAGAVVVRDVDDGETVVGIPAKPRSRFDDDQE